MSHTLTNIIHAPEGMHTRPALLIAHGLFGSARNFNTMGRRLASDRKVILVDMRNHGDSPWDDEVTYPAMAQDLAKTIETHADGRAIVMGHSMGGKAAMALALTQPDLLAGLVIADIAPVPYDHTHLGILQAMAAADLSGVTRRSEGDALMAAALPDPALRGFILQNLVVENGAARWRLNVPALAAGMDDLIDWPSQLSGTSYSGPTLSIYGGASPYVNQTAQAALSQFFPTAEFHEVPGAGHWLHAERPTEFQAALSTWLDTVS